MVDLSDEQGAFAKEENLTLRALEHKVGDLKREIGTRPEVLSMDYNAPMTWGSIGTMGSHLDMMAKNTQNLQLPPEKLAKEVKRAMDPLKEQLLEAVSRKMASLEMQINKIKMFALDSTKHLQKCINDQLEDAALNQFAQVPPAQKQKEIDKDKAKPERVDDVIKLFELRIKDLSTGLKVTAEMDEQAVCFAGLGFCSS
jgi:hypothetical protein